MQWQLFTLGATWTTPTRTAATTSPYVRAPQCKHVAHDSPPATSTATVSAITTTATVPTTRHRQQQQRRTQPYGKRKFTNERARQTHFWKRFRAQGGLPHGAKRERWIHALHTSCSLFANDSLAMGSSQQDSRRSWARAVQSATSQRVKVLLGPECSGNVHRRPACSEMDMLARVCVCVDTSSTSPWVCCRLSVHLDYDTCDDLRTRGPSANSTVITGVYSCSLMINQNVVFSTLSPSSIFSSSLSFRKTRKIEHTPRKMCHAYKKIFRSGLLDILGTAWSVEDDCDSQNKLGYFIVPSL